MTTETQLSGKIGPLAFKRQAEILTALLTRLDTTSTLEVVGVAGAIVQFCEDILVGSSEMRGGQWAFHLKELKKTAEKVGARAANADGFTLKDASASLAEAIRTHGVMAIKSGEASINNRRLY